MIGTLMKTRTQNVVATNTTAVFVIMTGWMPTIAIQRLRSVLAVVNRSTNLQVQLAIQTATSDIEKANAPVALGNVISTQTQALVDEDVTQALKGDVNAHMYFRLGVLVSSTGATVESGTVSLTPSFR